MDYIPRRINTSLDAQGNSLGHSGPVARRAQLEDGPCLTFTGTEYATDAGLVGTETVVSNGGTSTPSISAGRIDFTAGTCWDLILSNGSRYPMSEQVGTVAYDVVNSNHLQLVNTPSWDTQDVFFWGEHYGYSRSGQYDISTGVFNSVALSVAAQETGPTAMLFNDDGTKLYVMGSSGDDINQYDLGTAYDISTGVFNSVALSVAAQETAPMAMLFNDDGTKLYVMGLSGRDINRYDLSTAYDISTGVFNSIALSVAAQESQPYAMLFNDDGTKLYVMGQSGDDINQYDLGGILTPALSDGSADAQGNPITNPAGAYHNDTQATLKGYITDSDSEAAIYFGASFDGSSKIEFGDIGNTTEVEFDLYVPDVTGTKALLQIVSGDYIQLNGSTLEAVDIAGAAFEVDGVTSTTITAATWQTVRVTYSSKDSAAVILGNQSTSFLTGYVRNLTIKNDTTPIVIAPLYKDSLDRSADVLNVTEDGEPVTEDGVQVTVSGQLNHGTDTDVTYLNNPATEIAALNPTITATETLSVDDGNKKLILAGAK